MRCQPSSRRISGFRAFRSIRHRSPQHPDYRYLENAIITVTQDFAGCDLLIGLAVRILFHRCYSFYLSQILRYALHTQNLFPSLSTFTHQLK
jgi:hypothetical protein